MHEMRDSKNYSWKWETRDQVRLQAVERSRWDVIRYRIHLV